MSETLLKFFELPSRSLNIDYTGWRQDDKSALVADRKILSADAGRYWYLDALSHSRAAIMDDV
jgi:hypothetical protein